jgi:hypothetical protein
MTHFAKISNLPAYVYVNGAQTPVQGGIVEQVIVAEQDFVNTQQGTWKQTSYNTRGGVHYAPNSNTPDNGVALRGNYAGIGYIYDATNDVFYTQQPYASWTIAAPTWTWTAPVPMPTSGGPYKWDEATKSWVAQATTV